MRRIMSLILALSVLLSLAMVGGVTVFAASEMKASDQVVDFIKAYEGFSKYPYEDYGQNTVGYGTRCPDEKLAEYKANGITEAEAEALLREFIEKFELAVNFFADKKGLTFTQSQFDALVSFTYNLGSGWVYLDGNLQKTLANPNATAEEILYWFATYSFAGTTLLTPLTDRRLAEANMYINGVYSNSRPANYCYVMLMGNGGTVSNTVCAYDVNSDKRITPTVTRSGYSFAGWYNEDGEKVTTLDATTHGMTLYAQWTTGSGESGGFGAGEPLGAPVNVTVTNNGVNLRKGPGTNYTRIGQADKGDKLTITQVATGGSYLWGFYGDGWIALKYTNYESVLAGEDNAGTEDTEETPKTVTGTVNVNDFLRIRSGPGTGYSVAGYLYPNNVVTILEQKQVGAVTWGKIDKGWISLDYVILKEVEEAPEETVPEETTPEETTPEETTPEETTPEETTPEETTPEETPEEAPVKSWKVTVTNNGVNLRKGPGTNYTKVGTANKGDQLTITQTQQGGNYLWGCYGDGWIALKYTNYASVVAGEDDTTAEAPEDTTAKTVTGKVNVNDFLRVRSGPGTGYSVAGYLYPNDVVTITEQKQVGAVTWGKIDKGWISLDYVILDTAADNSGSSNNSGSADNSGSANTQTVTGTVDVNEFLRVRSGPGTSYAQVGYLYAGDKVTITEQKVVGNTTWGKIDKGWISLDYVDLDGQTSNNSNAQIKTITASCLRVRQSAGTGSTVVGYLYYGTKVEILETTTVGGVTWGRISNGWISLEYAQ